MRTREQITEEILQHCRDFVALTRKYREHGFTSDYDLNLMDEVDGMAADTKDFLAEDLSGEEWKYGERETD